MCFLFPVLKYLFQDHAFSFCNSSMYHILVTLTYQDYMRSVSSNTSTEMFFSYCHLFLTHPGSLPEAGPRSLGGVSLHTRGPPISRFGCGTRQRADRRLLYVSERDNASEMDPALEWPARQPSRRNLLFSESSFPDIKF